jgi:uncharacterized membrane protein
MKMRLFTFFDYLKSSYWLLPAVMNLVALVLGINMPYLENQFLDNEAHKIPWIYSGGAEGARTLMATIAGSMIGVAGVSFSITIVTLVLASSQFGPRLLRNFMRDKRNQFVLGSFLATFLYCLIILRHVEGGDSLATFVPNFSVSFGLFLAICSLALLIYFIHHVAESIQAPNVVAAVSRDLNNAIEHLFPEELEHDDSNKENISAINNNFEENFLENSLLINADGPGYIQRIDLKDLMKLAVEKDLVISIKHRPGHFIMKNDIVLLVHTKVGLDKLSIKRLQVSYYVSTQRTLAQDVAYAIDQLVEVAVRALSPGINDPFTAIQCINWLGDGLTHLANRKIPSPFQTDDQGIVRVIAYPITFESMVNAAFNMIRQNSKNSPSVMFKMLETIQSILSHTKSLSYRSILLEHADMVYQQARKNLDTDHDLHDLEVRHRRILTSNPK